MRSATLSSRSVFLSTPSARRATYAIEDILLFVLISIHALREEGDQALQSAPGTVPLISIHALREEGDTTLAATLARTYKISIHALREEGDHRPAGGNRQLSHFYPRPPRGGRQSRSTGNNSANRFLSTPSARRATSISMSFAKAFLHFYPRPPRGGRRNSMLGAIQDNIFLSTPSARRATAKTETKSLFSNKLYNILHEFRRALIYNGSKNYPNHAKRLENPVRRCRKNAENSPFAPGRKTQNNSRPSCSKGG